MGTSRIPVRETTVFVAALCGPQGGRRLMRYERTAEPSLGVLGQSCLRYADTAPQADIGAPKVGAVVTRDVVGGRGTSLVSAVDAVDSLRENVEFTYRAAAEDRAALARILCGSSRALPTALSSVADPSAAASPEPDAGGGGPAGLEGPVQSGSPFQGGEPCPA
jgi:hypothetical protein